MEVYDPARSIIFESIAVADLGFPPGGRQHTISPKFPKNCMKLKEFGPPGGGRVQNFTM